MNEPIMQDIGLYIYIWLVKGSDLSLTLNRNPATRRTARADLAFSPISCTGVVGHWQLLWAVGCAVLCCGLC